MPGSCVQWVCYPLDSEPLVSIIIPTRDRSDLLFRCVHGTFEKIDYRNLEALIIDNAASGGRRI